MDSLSSLSGLEMHRGDGQMGSMLQGMSVDQGVSLGQMPAAQSPTVWLQGTLRYWDFFLGFHQSLQGTAKPVLSLPSCIFRKVVTSVITNFYTSISDMVGRAACPP